MSTVSRSGRRAETHWQVVKRYRGFTLLRLDLKTGRTHQIRVHCAAMHHPVVGDPLYGGRPASRIPTGVSPAVRQTLGKVARQLLHAQRLGFTHPATLERVAFEAPLPVDMLAVMAALDAAVENAAHRP